MKKTCLLFSLLIIIILTAGCSTNSTSTSSSSTPQNSIRPEYKEITHAQFCLGNNTFEPPLVRDTINGWVHPLRMPIEPGKYKIIVTTSSPEAAIWVRIDYRDLRGYDKFGIPQYGIFNIIGDFTVDRSGDLNKEIIIPEKSIEGNISFQSAPSGYPTNPNCGTIIVKRLMV